MEVESCSSHVGPDALVRAGEPCSPSCRAQRGWAGEGTHSTSSFYSVAQGKLHPYVCLVALTLYLATIAAAPAQRMSGGILGPSASVKPPGVTNVNIEQRLNEQVPLDLTLRDETGKLVRLGDYMGKKPVILSLVYYRCPMLCNELLAGLESALNVVKFDVGNEFDVLTVSFDPKDTPEAATAKKADILKRYKRPGAEQGWHFLTGSQESI